LYIDRVNISVVAPILMTEFGWDPAVTGTILSAFFVGYFLTQLGSGVQVMLASKRLICNY
jgi:sugar phosphate permease